jgi:hypothetical protein
MCDYSLQHVASRPAKIEDKLVVTKFNNSITRGFAAVGEPHVAVCLLPGTEIAYEENVEYEPSFGIGILPTKKINPTLADAILDRVIHNAYRIELAGESMRKRRMPEPSA